MRYYWGITSLQAKQLSLGWSWDDVHNCFTLLLNLWAENSDAVTINSSGTVPEAKLWSFVVDKTRRRNKHTGGRLDLRSNAKAELTANKVSGLFKGLCMAGGSYTGGWCNKTALQNWANFDSFTKLVFQGKLCGKVSIRISGSRKRYGAGYWNGWWMRLIWR